MKKTAIVAVAALFLGAAQVASASFCPFSSSKKTHRPPPMMRPAYPVVLMPVAQQPGTTILTALQPVYLVPAYGMAPRPAPWAMPQYRYR
jgi:hypothetical protein